MKILNHKDAINRRLYNNQFFVLTAIYRVSWLNRTVLGDEGTNAQCPIPNSQSFIEAVQLAP
jgi:hypothetical protein